MMSKVCAMRVASIIGAVALMALLITALSVSSVEARIQEHHRLESYGSAIPCRMVGQGPRLIHGVLEAATSIAGRL